MNLIFNEIKNEFIKRNIVFSFQRQKIIEYLIRHRTHPTVDKIFNDLKRSIPTLSKTTVYNTLNLLEKHGLVRVISIDDNESRYDIDAKNHGHFKCNACGGIYDFEINTDSIASENLYEFKILEKSIYYKGICPNCL